MAVFRGHLSNPFFAPVLQKLHTVLVPAEVLLHCLTCAACCCRVDAGSASLAVLFLVALFSTTANKRGNSSPADDGSSAGVSVALAFEQVAHSDAR